MINMVTDNESDESDETSWQKVYASSVKRMRKELEGQTAKRPNPEYTNRFELLKDGENEDNIASTSAISNEEKMPPIFIPNVTNITQMMEKFNTAISRQNYHYKCLRDGQIKLITKDPSSFRNLIKYLNTSKILYHTYQMKKERAYRIVIKNLHHTTPIEYIRADLLEYGHDTRSITNIRSRQDKEPLLMFYVDLEPKDNNKDVFQIKYISNGVVKIEAPRHFDEIIQCHRCQQFGHTKGFCNKPFRCVKCGMDHPTAE